jgi:hypothetical protein
VNALVGVIIVINVKNMGRIILTELIQLYKCKLCQSIYDEEEIIFHLIQKHNILVPVTISKESQGSVQK